MLNQNDAPLPTLESSPVLSLPLPLLRGRSTEQGPWQGGASRLHPLPGEPGMAWWASGRAGERFGAPAGFLSSLTLPFFPRMDQSIAIQETLSAGETCLAISFGQGATGGCSLLGSRGLSCNWAVGACPSVLWAQLKTHWLGRGCIRTGSKGGGAPWGAFPQGPPPLRK